MGVTAAFVFAAQMLNFPVASGTSGHVIGGVLAAALLGPSAAVIVMTSVLLLQCLVFADGGLLALGANVLNMAVVQPLVGYAVYRALGGGSGGAAARRIAALAFGSWIATVVAAAACAGELALSGIVRAEPALAALLGVHAVIGLGEGAIAALVLATIIRLRPELAAPSPGAPGGLGASAALGLVGCVALALFVSPFACRWPDGLERAVAHLGVHPSHARVAWPALLPDYTVPGVHSWRATPLVAAAGTLVAFAVSGVLGICLAPRSRVRARRAATAPASRA
jgi:cobalt/nickel transport system permease protein